MPEIKEAVRAKKKKSKKKKKKKDTYCVKSVPLSVTKSFNVIKSFYFNTYLLLDKVFKEGWFF